MSAVESARANMEREYVQLGRVLQSTVQPGMIQKAARDFNAAADSYAELRRSGRGAS